MSYYDQTKYELESLIKDLKSASENFDIFFTKLKKEEVKLLDIRRGINQLARERQIGFPWLAKAYEKFFELQDKQIVDFLRYKKQPAIKVSEIVKEYSRQRR